MNFNASREVPQFPQTNEQQVDPQQIIYQQQQQLQQQQVEEAAQLQNQQQMYSIQQRRQETIKINNTQVKIVRSLKIDLKLFVGQIPKDWNEQDVTNFFSQYGEILESQIIQRDQQHKGCAFVKFASMTEAEKAIEVLQGKPLPKMNNPIQIKWADGEAERLGVQPGNPTKLFVGSLPKECTEQNLRDIFEIYGEVVELHLMRDNDQRPRGSAFVKYDKLESALLSIRHLNAQAFLEHSDKPIEVRFAEIKKKESKKQMDMDQQKMPQMNYGMMTNNYTQFQDINGNPYFLDWKTKETSYERPPPGALIHTIDGQSYIEPGRNEQGRSMRQKYQSSSQANRSSSPQNLNDLNGQKNPGPPGANLFIFHLPNDCKDSDLVRLFQEYGKVKSARIMTKPDGKSKGYGFVSYEDPKYAELAIKHLNGLQMGTKRLKVEIKKGDNGEESNVRQITTLNRAKFNPF